MRAPGRRVKATITRELEPNQFDGDGRSWEQCQPDRQDLDKRKGRVAAIAPPETSQGRLPSSSRGVELRDRRAVGFAFAVIGVAAVVGGILLALGSGMSLSAPPLFADVYPHVGPGSPAAVLLGWVGWRYGPGLARRLPWRRLLIAGYGAAVAWTSGLALIDGWQRGWVDRLATPDEYLPTAHGIGDPGAFLRSFTGNILDFRPGSFPTHVSSHPPLATLVFWALDRIGLPGGGWAGLLVVMVGSSAGIAVAVTLSACGAADAARTALPFLIFFPGAIWVGVSADGLFAGVAAWSIALAVLGLQRGGLVGALTAVTGGLLLGVTVYLSYGLLLLGLVMITGLALARTGRITQLFRTVWVVVGVGAVAVIMTATGFNWIEGVSLLTKRYYQGVAAQRAYAYFVWANPAALAVSAGPAVAAGLARAVPVTWRRRRGPNRFVPAALACAALLAVMIADVTGLSKAETERIWLPFAVWLVAATALLPPRSARSLLGVQIVVALIVNHLLLTHW